MSIHNIACEAGVIRQRVLKFILVKIIAAIFDFYKRGKVGREREIFKKGEWRGKGSQCKGFPRPLPHRRLHLQINIFG